MFGKPFGDAVGMVYVGTGETDDFVVDAVFVEADAAFAVVFVNEVGGCYGYEWELSDCFCGCGGRCPGWFVHVLLLLL